MNERTRIICDLVLSSIFIGLTIFIITILIFSLGQTDGPVMLLVFGVLICLFNLIGWWVWNSWRMTGLSVLAFIAAAFLFAFAVLLLPNTHYIADPTKFGSYILILLVCFYFVVILLAYKKPVILGILLVELTIMGAFAASPLDTYYNGQEIVLKTLPLSPEDRKSYDVGYVPTSYGIFKSAPDLKSYHVGDEVYLILSKQKEPYWIVGKITKKKPEDNNSTYVIKTEVIKDFWKPDKLSLSVDIFPDIPRKLLPATQQKKSYLVKLRIGRIGTLIQSVNMF